MKICRSTLFRVVLVWLVVMMSGPARVLSGIGRLHGYRRGLPVPCKNQQATKLDPPDRCFDIEGFQIPCRNKQFTIVDQRNKCLDLQADRYAEGPPVMDLNRCPDKKAPALLSQYEVLKSNGQKK